MKTAARSRLCLPLSAKPRRTCVVSATSRARTRRSRHLPSYNTDITVNFALPRGFILLFVFRLMLAMRACSTARWRWSATFAYRAGRRRRVLDTAEQSCLKFHQRRQWLYRQVQTIARYARSSAQRSHAKPCSRRFSRCHNRRRCSVGRVPGPAVARMNSYGMSLSPANGRRESSAGVQVFFPPSTVAE